MTAQTDTSRRDDLIARNLAAVETHFHNETPETIDQAIAVYTDDIVLGGPGARPGAAQHRGRQAGVPEDLRLDEHPQDRQPAPVRDRGVGVRRQHLRVDHHRGRVPQLPVPAGTTVSVRLLHAFQCRDGKICREHGYEIWRDINDHARVQDDIPATATVEVFG